MKSQKRHKARRSPASNVKPSTARPATSPEINAAQRKKRLWLFRLIAVLSPLLLLGLIESGMRITGYGFSTDFFLRLQINGKEVLTDNPKFGRWFFPPALARAAAPFSIPAQKPPDTYRIYVLGESAAMGDPAPAFGFSRMIAVMLQERYPGTRFEVVNTGVTAINSHTIVPIARDCARHEGDLWLTYMGNNEVVGPYGAGTIFGAEAPPLPVVRASMAIKGSRIGQGLGALLSRLKKSDSPQATWGGMKMFLDRQVTADDPRMQRVYDNFENNLETILHVGSKAGVKHIVCTVGSNLKDCPPFASLHRRDLTKDSASSWENAFTNGVIAQAAGRFAEANDFYAQAEKIDPDYAELHFRRGRCFGELKDFEQARHSFERARDLDTLRFRPDDRINEIIERRSQQRTAEGIRFLDIAALLMTNSVHGIPGEDMFYEHVHLTFQGNYVVARAAMNEIAQLLPENIRRRQVGTNWLSGAECAWRLGWNEWSQYQVVEEVRGRLREPPFVNQLDHAEQMKKVEQLLASHAVDLETAKRAVRQYSEALARNPDDPMLRERLAVLLAKFGDISNAIQQWKKIIELLPHHSASYESLGTLLSQTGQNREGEKYFIKALEMNPESVGALNGRGLSLTGQKRFAEAQNSYEQALKLKPPYPIGLHINLGFALENQEKNLEAEIQYREALRLEPQNAMARLNLGVLLLKQSKMAEATVEFKEAVQRHPNLANSHLGLGMALEQSNEPAAIREYEEAVRLEPANESAKNRLQRALARRDRKSP